MTEIFIVKTLQEEKTVLVEFVDSHPWMTICFANIMNHSLLCANEKELPLIQIRDEMANALIVNWDPYIDDVTFSLKISHKFGSVF